MGETVTETPVINPAAVEANITECVNRIARGVQVVTEAERKARAARRNFDLAFAQAYKRAEDLPAHARRYEADILTMGQREESDTAEIAFRHAERTAKALEKELLAWQSVLNSVRAMYNAAGVR
jgi:predicted  nucleic acid-binding Zn-ribbon protein